MRFLPALVLAGCGYLGSARPFNPAHPPPGMDLLAQIEPVRQGVENDCGPAALTMVLRWHEDPLTLEEAVKALPPREGGGVTAGALRDFARARGFRAHVVAGTFDDLRKQIALGRPLVVGLIKPYISKLVPHFEVLAGIDPEAKCVVTVDPARGWMRNSFDGFLLEWDASGRVTLIVAPAPQ